MSSSLHVVDHPLVKHKLTLMRRVQTTTFEFRSLAREIAMLMAYEVTKDFPLIDVEIETPLCKMHAPEIDGKKIVLVSVLRAGNGFLDGMMSILPSARVGHVGMYRDEETLEAHEYYFKLPQQMTDRDVIVLDPMLATGNSAIAAVSRIRRAEPRSMKFMCLLSAPEGVDAFSKIHPDVPIFTAAVDEKLNEKGYIVPGLGDAGDRLFGTK